MMVKGIETYLCLDFFILLIVHYKNIEKYKGKKK